MSPELLRNQLERAFPAGTVLDNPGGGTSEIVSYQETMLRYKRGKSSIYLRYDDVLAVVEAYRGRTVTSAELKAFAPSVFDSSARPAGHSCNCTMLFLLLGGIGLVGKIQGEGVRGNPFAAEIGGVGNA